MRALPSRRRRRNMSCYDGVVPFKFYRREQYLKDLLHSSRSVEGLRCNRCFLLVDLSIYLLHGIFERNCFLTSDRTTDSRP